MVLRRSIIVFALIIFSFSIFVAKHSEADGQSGKESGLLNMSLGEYKEKVIDIPKDLQRLLRSYIKVNGLGVLFKSNRGNGYTRNQLSQIFMKTSQEYLGKNISTTLLRKIYLSDKYSEVKKEMAKDAYIMGHSVETQQKIYTKDLPQQGQDKQPNKGVISNDS